ncbi:dihydrofolate reductase [Emticicia sp. BO119]|uniref:dihydrofolate reductase n=1 Tax=Emticicia sp. BO119 TaxID=2757768 RepID=UPI0015EFE24B|nr:dihydrofolate reductase [Emticicia sp. BO119]MBA4851142.1 dihydrofolate reductase [Emticicia sp. BO119]
MPIISLIAAMSENRAIGLNNALPWPSIPADWDNLKKVTQGKKMIMGRKSYDSPHRLWSEAGNYVITRQHDYAVDQGFEVVRSLEEALEKCTDQQEVFVLGGEEIFKLAIPIADRIYLTIVHQVFDADTFFPTFDESAFDITDHMEFKAGENTPYDISILTYQRKGS